MVFVYQLMLSRLVLWKEHPGDSYGERRVSHTLEATPWLARMLRE